MTKGPFGGPRPFAREETLKLVVSVKEMGSFNETNFKNFLSGSTNMGVSTVDMRILPADAIAVDTGFKNAQLDKLNGLVKDVDTAVNAAGGHGIGETKVISTQNTESALE